MILALFLILVPAVLAALAMDTIRAATDDGDLTPIESTYRTYGA